MQRPSATPKSMNTVGVLMIIVPAICACVNDQPTKPLPLSASASSPLYSEEEFFGNIYQNGQKTTSTSFYASLAPANQVTAGRLKPPQSSSAWADPNPLGSWMYGWYDPRGGGGCGDLGSYLAGTVSARALESHRPSPGQPPPNTPESHCIRPGTYQFSAAAKTFRVDYLQAATDVAGSTLLVTNTTAGRREYLESAVYQDYLPFWDYVVHVDLGPSSFSETSILDVENALADLKKTTFSNQANPSGTEQDYFRFSVARSQSSWNLASGDIRGRMLARFYWDFNTNKQISSNYFDPRSDSFAIRLHTFSDHVTQSRSVTVALEIMRPDEAPDDTIHVVTRSVLINRITPYACASFETVTTWRTTDQYLMSSCSTRGPEIRYRWQFTAGGPWTPYSPDTLYDFAGHTGTGSQQVTLGVLNTSTGQSSTSPRTVAVQSGQVGLNGPTYVTDKGTKLYTSNISGQWFERYNPDLRWNPATAYYYTSMNRIWPAGDYTIELRQQDSTPSLVRRGRLHITICHSDPTPCQPLAPPTFAVAPARDTTTGIFGAGPWITWSTSSGQQLVRFYDLAGAHDLSSPFSDGSWLTDSGTVGSFIPGANLSWRHMNLGLPGVRAVAFDLSGFGPTDQLAFGLTGRRMVRTACGRRHSHSGEARRSTPSLRRSNWHPRTIHMGYGQRTHAHRCTREGRSRSSGSGEC
jgi:hypothetical protein